MHDIGRPTPTVNVNINMNWDSMEYSQSAQEYVASPLSDMEERMQQQQHAFYTLNGTRVPPSFPPPPPSAPYAWPVDSYGIDVERQPQVTGASSATSAASSLPHSHPQQQQQQQQFTQGIYTHPQHSTAYQAHNAELARLGLASRLDERRSTFMEDSGLLEGIDFRAR
jgi:hypothetical protein